MHARAAGDAADGTEMGEVADRLVSPVAVVAADSTLLYVNPAGARSVGGEPGLLMGQRMLDLIHPSDRERVTGELRLVADGRPSAGLTTFRIRADASREWRVFESVADNLLDDARVGGILISSRDITDQRARERDLFDAAYRDPLTGLPNRNAINDRLELLATDEAPLAVAFIGIDRLDLIRNSLGHGTADVVVQVVAARVRLSVPASLLVGQFSGDVVAIVFAGAAAADARDLLWRIIERVSEPMFIAGHELRVSASAGLAHRDATATPDSLLHDAALALHRAGHQGGGRVETFERTMRDAAVARLEMEADLRRALVDEELWLALQPIVRLDDRTPVRAEALLRWEHQQRTIEPRRFIPVAEDTGLIVPIGDWTIDQAAGLAAEGLGAQILVNLSPRQLAVPSLPERIARILATHHTPPSAVGFELTETLLIEHFDYTAEILRRIRQLGCPIGLDDFGTGYSSLSYLRRLPLDFIKVDGALTADIDTDRQARAITGAIITMADALGLDVIAEGVERQSQADALQDLGCSLGQGFLFGPPRRASR